MEIIENVDDPTDIRNLRQLASTIINGDEFQLRHAEATHLGIREGLEMLGTSGGTVIYASPVIIQLDGVPLRRHKYVVKLPETSFRVSTAQYLLGMIVGSGDNRNIAFQELYERTGICGMLPFLAAAGYPFPAAKEENETNEILRLHPTNRYFRSIRDPREVWNGISNHLPGPEDRVLDKTNYTLMKRLYQQLATIHNVPNMVEDTFWDVPTEQLDTYGTSFTLILPSLAKKGEWVYEDRDSATYDLSRPDFGHFITGYLRIGNVLSCPNMFTWREDQRSKFPKSAHVNGYNYDSFLEIFPNNEFRFIPN